MEDSWSTEQFARDYDIEPNYQDLRSEALRDYVSYFDLNPRSWRSREYLIVALKRHYQIERDIREQQLLEDERKRALETEKKAVQNERRFRMCLLGILLAFVEAERFFKFGIVPLPDWYNQAGLLCYMFDPFAYAFVYTVFGRTRVSIPRILLDQIVLFVGTVALPADFGRATVTLSAGSIFRETAKFAMLGQGLSIIGPFSDRASQQNPQVRRDTRLWMFVRMYLWSELSIIALAIALVDQAIHWSRSNTTSS